MDKEHSLNGVVRPLNYGLDLRMFPCALEINVHSAIARWNAL